MKEYKELLGYVEIENTNYPFHFSSETFDLKVFPPTIDLWNEKKDSLFMNFGRLKPNKNNWIGTHQIEGTTAQGYHILFLVSDGNRNFNGFETFHVIWMVYHRNKSYDFSQINGLRFSGGDINLFYPAHRILKPKFTNRVDGLGYKELQISSKSEDYQSCGKYRAAPHIDAEIRINSFATLHFQNEKNPMDAESVLLVDFSCPVTIDTVIQTIHDLFLFFVFTCYRRNICFPKMDVYWFNSENKKDFDGSVFLSRKSTPESHNRVQDRIIGFDFWGKKMSRMLTAIKNKKLDFEHVCDDISSQRSYPHSRFILVLTEFEREFRNIYGNNYQRSAVFAETKKDVVAALDKLANEKTGRSKKQVKEFIKSIQNTDNSYSSRVKAALFDCIDIMRSFIEREYGKCSPSIIDGVSNRVGDLRNGFAHSRLDLKIKPIHLNDIVIIEMLTYAIRLKQYEKDPEKVHKALAKLFGILF